MSPQGSEQENGLIPRSRSYPPSIYQEAVLQQSIAMTYFGETCLFRMVPSHQFQAEASLQDLGGATD